MIRTDERQNELWENYSGQHSYAEGITVDEVLNAVYELLDKISHDKR